MGLSQWGEGTWEYVAGKWQNMTDGIEIDLKFMGWAIVFLQGKKWGGIILEIFVCSDVIAFVSKKKSPKKNSYNLSKCFTKQMIS